MSQSEVRKLLSGCHVGPRPAPYALDSIEIELPMPPRATHPNASNHNWRPKAFAIKRQREDAAIAAKLALKGSGPPRWERVTIQATLYVPGNRAKVHDATNIIGWLKPTEDGISEDAGIIANDRGVTWLPPIQKIGAAAEGERKLVLVITRRDEP